MVILVWAVVCPVVVVLAAALSAVVVLAVVAVVVLAVVAVVVLAAVLWDLVSGATSEAVMVVAYRSVAAPQWVRVLVLLLPWVLARA